MIRYIGKRLIMGAVSLIVLVTVVFFLTRLMPGSPFQSGNGSLEVLEAMEEEYGLNDPVLVQYKNYILGLVKGDLGISYKKPGVTVNEVIKRAWPVTVSVGVPAFLLATAAGVGFGMWQAFTRSKAVKGGLLICTSVGAGIPNFVLALILMLFFGVQRKILPIAGLLSPLHYILPVVSLAVYPASVTARLIHNTFASEMQKDYVTMAQAKGLSNRRIAVTHILKNAGIPVLQYIGPMAAFLLTGSFAVESIFTIPGLGREFVNSIGNRDYTLIMGLTVFMGMVVILINLGTDILCAWLDPRIRRSYVEIS